MNLATPATAANTHLSYFAQVADRVASLGVGADHIIGDIKAWRQSGKAVSGADGGEGDLMQHIIEHVIQDIVSCGTAPTHGGKKTSIGRS